MAKQLDSEESEAASGSLQPEERRTLLEELQRLYRQIWRRIWARRFEDRDYGVARDPGILGSLNRHIDQAVEASRSRQPGVVIDDEPEAVRPARESSGDNPAGGGRSNDASPGGLSDYMHNHESLSAVHSNLGEQMRSSTWEHMVMAVRLANRGDDKGARVHAELANNAMKEASIYMTEDEYAAFEAEVKERLNTLPASD